MIRATSDLHLSPSTAEYVFAALEVVRADAAKSGGWTVLVGDLFDQPKSVDMALYNRFRAMLRTLGDVVVIVPGNHDQYRGWRNACEALAVPGEVIVCTEPQMVPGVGLCVPYTDPGQWRAIVAQWKSFPAGTPPLVWAHQGFRGSYLNSMTRDRTGLVAKDLPGELVVTGHYHMPQTCGPVIYCGSPYQTSHAEEGQTKGYLRWADPDVEILPERIAFGRIAPSYHTAEWEPGFAPVVPTDYREGDIVRVRTKATRREAKDAARELADAGLSGSSIVAQPNAAIDRGVIDRGLNPDEAVRQYIERTAGPDLSQPSPTTIFDFGRELGLCE